ncbi:unnamed protein product, partial [Allacma fusca]
APTTIFPANEFETTLSLVVGKADIHYRDELYTKIPILGCDQL